MTSSARDKGVSNRRNKSSLIGAIDPTFKLAWVISLSIFAATLADARVLIGLLALTFFNLFFASLREARQFISFWRVFFFIPPLLFLFHASSNYILRDGLSEQAMMQVISESSIYSLRILNSLFVLVLFIVTTDIRALVDRLCSLGVPFKFAFSIYLMLRFVDLLTYESQQIWSAVTTRFGAKMGLLTRLHIAVRYGVTLIVLGIRRAEQTAIAMDLRGFANAGTRTFFGPTKWAWTKWPYLAGNGGVATWILFNPDWLGVIRGLAGY
jgi:energy-coupling factor transport system permease protein